MSRRKSRILAFQGLYSYDIGGVPLEDLTSFTWAGEVSSDLRREENTFARLLLAGTIEHIDEIDKIIASHLSEKWSLDRLNKVSLEILRLATYEILYQGEAGAIVIIDEAVKIAKEYGADDSFKFINAILDNIKKEQ